MSVRFPDLSSTKFGLLVVCGAVQTDDDKLLKWLSAQEPVAARIGSGTKPAYIQLFFGHREDKKRLHIEIVAPGFRRDGIKRKRKQSDIQKILARLEGQRVVDEIEGYYQVPVSELPLLIRSSMEESMADGVSIRMSSGTLSVRGAPISRIDWFTREQDEQAMLCVIAKKEMVVGDNYLTDAVDLVEAGFRAIRQGEK